jgi:hypothetical protein
VEKINVVIFWAVRQRCSMIGACQIFGGIFCLEINIEDGSSIFLRNVGTHLLDCNTLPEPEDHIINLKIVFKTTLDSRKRLQLC